MGLIKTINTKIQSAVAKKVPTADEAYSQALSALHQLKK